MPAICQACLPGVSLAFPPIISQQVGRTSNVTQSSVIPAFLHIDSCSTQLPTEASIDEFGTVAKDGSVFTTVTGPREETQHRHLITPNTARRCFQAAEELCGADPQDEM